MARDLDNPLGGESKSNAPPGVSADDSRDEDSIHGAIELVAEKSARLVALVRNLPVEGVEGSFKMERRAILSNRLMIGVRRANVDDARLLEIVRGLEPPGEFLADFESRLPSANLVLLGFEAGTDSFIYKVYLEYWDRLVQAVNTGQRAPALLHLGFKWNALTDAKVAVTRYYCHPMLTAQEILERVRSFHPRLRGDQPLAAVEGIFQAACRRTDFFVYLEGQENESPRRSYDVNLYKANLNVGDVRGELAALRDHFEVPADQFDRLMGRIAQTKLGHISGGLGRSGEDFVTFYYDVE